MIKFLYFVFLLFNSVHASTVKYFDPFKEITNMSFQLKSEQISNLLKAKFLNLAPKENPYFDIFYVRPGRLEAVLQNASSINEEVKVRLEQYIQRKMLLLIESNLEDFLQEYEKDPSASAEQKYTDQVGILDFQEVLVIKSDEKEASLRLKKPLGTHRINYILAEEHGKTGVLKQIKKQEYEGIGSNKIQIDFSYQMHGEFYLPRKVSGRFEQQMRGTDSGQDVFRTIEEEIILDKFQINDNSALKWFSRKS